jgi:hypothetical protein
VTGRLLTLLLLLSLAAAGCGGDEEEQTPGAKPEAERAQRQTTPPARDDENKEQDKKPLKRTVSRPRPAALKPCSLLTRSDISDALGREVRDDGRPRNAGLSHICDWKVAGALNFRVAVFDTVHAYLPKTHRKGFRQVSGPGEAAEFRGRQPVAWLSEIWVRLHDGAFMVQFTVPVTKKAPDDEGPFVSLAEKVLDRLDESD